MNWTSSPGFYAPCSHPQVSKHLTLLSESLPPDPSEQLPSLGMSRGNRNKCPVPGILYNTNTLESFHALDKRSLLNMEAKKVFFLEKVYVHYLHLPFSYAIILGCDLVG